RPWNGDRTRGRGRADPYASMEPRLRGRGMRPRELMMRVRVLLQWSHGSEAVETSDRVRRWRLLHRFNGATARRPWKHGSGWPRGIGRCRLQWSHGSEAVETDPGHERRHRREVASMEPRLGGRGNGIFKPLLDTGQLRLQW